MSFNFRKIYAKDPFFVKTKEINIKEHTYFQKYADSLTEQSGKARNNKSGKGRSYADYLIRLVILYQEFYKEEINNLLTFTTLKKIEKVVRSEEFEEYNKSENRFPNATFNCYISCVTHLNTESENKADLQFNNSLEDIVSNEEDPIGAVIDSAQKRKKKVNTSDALTYPRSKVENLEAKRRSNWRCDLDYNHITFISNANKKPYIEAHHLIPMSAQGYFENTIDFADNIVCLCPNCHRKIHYAKDIVKRELLENLFKKRKKRYYKYSIDINFRKLLNFYEIT